ncbi:uncharacterized protein si:zfos-741a10.3 [Pungitius pungitius]|uniref:uncharacterized protein si:zfos-741a10.3 n=1 Tax=Pungitius pungitius TaxID=134920 RepID=UPI002E0F1DA1
MDPVILLLVMLAGVSNAFLQAGETKCNATQSSSQCSVALGGSVCIQLMTNASGRHLQFKKKLPAGVLNVFSLKRDKVTVHETYRNRTEFLSSSSTLKMTKMARNDSGLYIVDVFDLNGLHLRTTNVTLDVQGNIWHILIPVCSVMAALLIVVSCCCVCCKVWRRRKTGRKQLEGTRTTMN